MALEFAAFCKFFFLYLRQKVVVFSITFEKNKNKLVKVFIMKRGRYNRPFLHVATMGVLALGVLVTPYLADTYPIFASQASALDLTQSENQTQSIIVGQNVFRTDVSQKPRDKVIDYTVQKGDTLSTIAEKFGISPDTVRWANDMTGDSITVGDSLKILPVSGIGYKVQAGDTVYSIAKKFNTEPQKIVDFPFNEFANPETFSLVDGQMLIVPDGIKPSEQQTIKPHVYVVTGPVPVSGGGFTWPVHGTITQFASWYHMALDIAAPYGTPIVAADDGTVERVSVGTYDTGYGNNVWINKGDGFESHYAHMEAVNVSVGQHVTGGQTVIGWIGMTGRTTGPHVHFEIRHSGSLVNPLPYLQ